MKLKPTGSRDNPRCNGEGYPDPTAYEAIAKADLDIALERQAEERFKALLYVIKDICKIAGFELEERVVLKDTRTGKVWR